MNTMDFSRMCVRLAVAVVLVAIPVLGGEQGPCRYEGDECSCKLGQENQGICWDRTSGTPSAGICESRYCRAGWTCSCAGRTHVCKLKNRPVNVVDRKFENETAECHEELLLKPVPPFLKLGSWSPSLSREGLLANDCRELAWWHNGVLMGHYGVEPEINGANVDAQLERRTNHTLLELKKGDLIAFRFRHGSYHCYNGISNLNVNGTTTTSADPWIETMFARGHSDNWFTPDFDPVVKTDEATAAITDFVPLRTTMLSGDPDPAGEDNWQEPDGSQDHKTSNFYFRMQL